MNWAPSRHAQEVQDGKSVSIAQKEVLENTESSYLYQLAYVGRRMFELARDELKRRGE